MIDATNFLHTARTPGDLVEALPALFGFTPTDSVVVITTHGDRNRLGFRLRADRPETPEQRRPLAEMIAGHVSRHVDPDGSVIVIVVAGDVDEGMKDLGAVLDALSEPVLVAGVAGLGVFTEWGTGAVWPYEDPAHSAATVAAVALGQNVQTSREALVASLAPTYAEAYVADGEIDTGLCLAVLAGTHDLTAEARVAFTRACRNIDVRDYLWGEATAETAGHHAATWTAVALPSHRRDVAGLFAMASMATYLSGDGARARTLADTALKHDAEQSLAKVTLVAIDSGMSPAQWFEMVQ